MKQKYPTLEYRNNVKRKRVGCSKSNILSKTGIKVSLYSYFILQNPHIVRAIMRLFFYCGDINESHFLILKMFRRVGCADCTSTPARFDHRRHVKRTRYYSKNWLLLNGIPNITNEQVCNYSVATGPPVDWVSRSRYRRVPRRGLAHRCRGGCGGRV